MEVVKIEKRILSPTAINTFLSCPRKFYLRYMRKLRTRQSVHLIRGHIVHKTIGIFHRNHPRIMSGTPIGAVRKDLLAIFKDQWDRAFYRLSSLGLTQEEISYYHDDSEIMLLHFSHWLYKNGMQSPDLSEIRIHSNTLRLMGIIDAVFTLSNKVFLVDYKTSKHPRITDDIKRQAALYALLYKDKYKTVPEAVLINFLKVPDDAMPVHVDDHLLQYGTILIDSVQRDTVSQDERDYPCTCGGYCERDFIGAENGAYR